MKNKAYITPLCKCYAVSSRHGIMEAISASNYDVDDSEKVKEEIFQEASNNFLWNEINMKR